MTGPQITAEQLAELPALIAACRISGDHETLAASATDLAELIGAGGEAVETLLKAGRGLASCRRPF